MFIINMVKQNLNVNLFRAVERKQIEVLNTKDEDQDFRILGKQHLHLNEQNKPKKKKTKI